MKRWKVVLKRARAAKIYDHMKDDLPLATVHMGGGTPKDMVSNAHLMAEAPEMLDLLEQAYDRFTDDDFYPQNHALQVWCERALAAISKAHGVKP